jgi:hypothetical protein
MARRSGSQPELKTDSKAERGRHRLRPTPGSGDFGGAKRLAARLRCQQLIYLAHDGKRIGHAEHVGLAARWIGLPVSEGQHFLPGTASLSILGYEPNHSKVPIIALWNAGSGGTA